MIVHAAVELVGFTGRVVHVGYVKDPVKYETRLFAQKELDILGARNALLEDFREVIRTLEEHRFDDAVSSVVTRRGAEGIVRLERESIAG